MSKAFLKDIDNTIHYSPTADVSSETNSSSFFASATNPDARHAIFNDVGGNQHVKYVLEAEGYSCVEATLAKGERLFCHSQTCRPSIILRGELGRKYSSRLIDNERSNILWLCGGPGLAKRRMRPAWCPGWPR